MIKSHRVLLAAMCTLIFVGSVHPQNADERAIAFARELDVVRLDTTQPHMQFGDWLQHFAGRKATISWEINDCRERSEQYLTSRRDGKCGEQIGNPADSNLGIPTCVEAKAMLTDGRTVGVMISVGTFKTGLSTTPGVFNIYIGKDGKFTNLRRLRELVDHLTNNILKSMEAAIRKALPELAPELVVEYPRQSFSLVIKYKTQKYMVHRTNKTGAISKDAFEEEGPSYRGFILEVWLEESDTPTQAVIPQTLHEAYWSTDLDYAPVGSGEQQLRWNLSYGVRTDRNILLKIRSVMIECTR